MPNFAHVHVCGPSRESIDVDRIGDMVRIMFDTHGHTSVHVTFSDGDEDGLHALKAACEDALELLSEIATEEQREKDSMEAAMNAPEETDEVEEADDEEALTINGAR